MLRRSVLQFSHLSSSRSHGRIPLQITTQVPSYLSSGRVFSAQSQQNGPRGPYSTDEDAKSGSALPIIIFGGVALGATSLLAYKTGYFDKYLGKESLGTLESAKAHTANQGHQGSKSSEEGLEPITDSRPEDTNMSSSDVENAEKNSATISDSSVQDNINRREEESRYQVKDEPKLRPEHMNHVQENELPSSLESTSGDTSSDLSKPSEESLRLKTSEVIVSDQPKAVELTPSLSQENTAGSESEGDQVDGSRQSNSLLGEYYLKKEHEEPTTDSANKSQDLHEKIEDSYISRDGKLVLDFLQAIHAAEDRQAELDARTFTEEKRMMKAKYEKELRDARARELMYAERDAILEKELNKERVKAAAALKALDEDLAEKHKMELENKASEAELELKKVQELAKAELASAVASEKAAQIEKMAEANLNINALCMAFYARSEEARHSHSVHKLALGALALEAALSKGLPIQKEGESLNTYLEGIDKDSLLHLVLSSLPEETRTNGTDTPLQLNHKFDTLKGTLRHFSLLPPGGGGILSHSLAHIASWLKVRESDQAGDGIESVMNRVDRFLAEGKLIEAADALENGVKGTQAGGVVDDWLRRARNRAITEQALTLLQAYATSLSLT